MAFCTVSTEIDNYFWWTTHLYHDINKTQQHAMSAITLDTYSDWYSMWRITQHASLRCFFFYLTRHFHIEVLWLKMENVKDDRWKTSLCFISEKKYLQLNVCTYTYLTFLAWKKICKQKLWIKNAQKINFNLYIYFLFLVI